MAFGHATSRTDSGPDQALAPALAVLITARSAAMSMRVSPTLRAQGLPSFLIELPASPSARLPPLLRERPAACIGFVDAPAGLALARTLGLGLVVGIGAGSRATALLEAGADLAIGSPAELCAGAFYDAYARRFEGLPDPLHARQRWEAHLGAGGGWGVLLDGRTLARAREDAAAIAALARLPARVPIAILGGSDVRARARALGLDRADALAHDGLALAPSAVLDPARRGVEAAALRLSAVARELGTPAPVDDGVGLRLDLPRMSSQERARARREVMRALAGLSGIEWDVDAHGLELRPVVGWPAAQRLAALRAWWVHRAGAARVLLLAGTPRYEPWLRALEAQDAGVLLAPRPVPTGATWRLAGDLDVAELLAPLGGSDGDRPAADLRHV